MRFDIVGEYYTQRNLDLAAQECINFYPTISKSNLDSVEGKGIKALYPTPGLKLLNTFTEGTCRGLAEFRNLLFGVFGNKLYEITMDVPNRAFTSATERGTLSTGNGDVFLVPGTDEMFIHDGTYGYYYDTTTTTLTQMNEPGLTAASGAAFMDSYAIISQPDSNFIRSSNVGDITSWNALNVASAESDGDYVVGIKTKRKELWVFGKKTIEIWYNSANDTGFPFSRRPDAYFNIGAGAAQGMVTIDNVIVWLDDHNQIMLAEDYSPQMISTEAINIALQDKDLSTAQFSWVNHGGHDFCICNFPSIDKCFVYDLDTGAWHERKSTLRGKQRRWLANQHVRYKSLNLTGSWEDGSFYLLDDATYTDGGNAILRVRTTHHGFRENKRICVNSLDLIASTGTGLQTGQGSDPTINLEISKDGGHTYGPHLPRSLGAVGEYGTRCKWNRLGSAREWTLRFSISDPVFVSLQGAIIEVNGEATMVRGG